MDSFLGKRKPDWKNMGAVLERAKPSRPTLFELFLNDQLIESVSGIASHQGDVESSLVATVRAHAALGYDCCVQQGSDFHYPDGRATTGQTISLNDGALITDRESFDRYPWPDPQNSDYSWLDITAREMPEGMRQMVWTADGLLETVVKLTGYENLCYLLYDDEPLVADIFERVGQGYLDYYRRCVDHPSVMALVSSDDWGFNTQTLLPPDVMRKYLFPWQKEYIQLAHSRGKYAVLHSCGYFMDILDDILELGFDARHSYEDAILPVEDAYALMQGKIAVLGGIDVDFLVRADTGQIEQRARRLLELSETGGGYALGSGNSIADYIPLEHYYAMIKVALEG